MESLSQFGLTVVKDGMGSCLTLQGLRRGVCPKVTAKKRSKGGCQKITRLCYPEYVS